MGLAFIPETILVMASVRDEVDSSRIIASLLFSIICAIHISISFSMSRASWRGFPVPGVVILPSASIEPEASTTWIRASACPIILRNWFPSPRPVHASFINPGMSMSFIGTYRQPSMHAEF